MGVGGSLGAADSGVGGTGFSSDEEDPPSSENSLLLLDTRGLLWIWKTWNGDRDMTGENASIVVTDRKIPTTTRAAAAGDLMVLCFV